MIFRPNSLRFRLLVSTALLVAIVLPVTAFALTSYYRNAMEQAFDQRLKVHLDNLVAISLRDNQESGLHVFPEKPADAASGAARDRSGKVAGAASGDVAVAIELGEPLFRRPFSGWYWQISLLNGQKNSTLISDSLLDQRLAFLPPSTNDDGETVLQKGYIAGPEGQVLRAVERVIIAGGGDGGDDGKAEERYSYMVAVSSSELDGQVAQFRNMLFLALGLLGTGLILAGIMQVRYGLAPLFVISRKLNEIRSGKADRLSGSFPAEIEPLQTELNALIRSNREIVERARTHVGNLAHALKTPLSVIANEMDKIRQKGPEAASFSQTIDKQIKIMDDQVRHHLERARMAAQTGVVGGTTSVRPVIDSLTRTLQKIYKEKALQLTCDCDEELLFRGERQDLEEMLGNLLENSFKWASRQIILSARVSRKRAGYLTITVDDDGPGLSAGKREKAMQRGQRLDENLPGSGLGLSIVADLSHLYEGDFQLETAPSGGLRARLHLPLAS